MKNIIGISIALLTWMYAPGQTINKVEYTIDSDPGFGNGNNVAVSAAANISNLPVAIPTGALGNGFHHLFLRSRDNTGTWSLTSHCVFVKDAVAANVNKLEYFVDTDPGFGNGNNITVTASPDIANIIVPVGTGSLANGLHTLFLRSRDNTGNWSISNHWLFVKESVSTAVNKFEYFVDTDPGFGNGSNVSIVASSNVGDVVIPVNITSLSLGFHSVYLRSKDDKGNWSVTNRWIFFKDIAQGNLLKGEYFFDNDPGFGNGSAIVFGGSPGTDLADFSFIANAAGLTSNGTHLLFVRTKEANGKWSLTNVLPFDYLGPVPVTLLNFQVKAAGKQAHLNWQTVTEQNSARFEIERSDDARHFIKIGSVRAAGNSSSLISYSFIDDAPKKGINYYRLREVDLDNRVQYSEVRIATFNAEPVLILYSNLSTGAPVNVHVSVYPVVLSVFDAAGKKIKEINITGDQYSLPVTGFANGTYIAVLNNGGRILAVEQFIVNK